jgi:Protein of unknown function VcgC/VcgE (DUF2780)
VSRMRNLISAYCLLVFLAVVTGQTQAQTPVAKAAKNPSSELINQLTQQLSVTPKQAAGGAGTLFGVAKSNLSPENFNKIAAVVPGMNGLLKAAPAAAPSGASAASASGGLSGLANALPGKAGGLMSAASSFQKLGMSPDMVGKFVPQLTQFVGAKGGPGVASLLSGALK